MFWRFCGRAVQPARLFKLAGVIHGVENPVRGARDAAFDRDSRRYEHLIEHSSTVPRFCRVEDEFSAVLGANDSGHARILCQRGAAVALMQIQSKIGP